MQLPRSLDKEGRTTALLSGVIYVRYPTACIRLITSPCSLHVYRLQACSYIRYTQHVSERLCIFGYAA